jgi:hypothetical protein
MKTYFPGWKIHPVISDSQSTFDNQQVDIFGPLYMLEFGSTRTVSNASITAVLPVTETSARSLKVTITGLLGFQSVIQEVVIVCPESLLSTSRSSIRHVITSYGQTLSALLTLRPCSHTTCATSALIETAFYVSTDWTLFLEDSGLRKVDRTARSLLLNPPDVTFPLGLRGFSHPKSEAHWQKDTMCLMLASRRPADFLVPPFVIPNVIMSDVNALPDLILDSWTALGRWVSEKRPDAIGGVIVNLDIAADDCFDEVYSDAQDARNTQRLSTPPIDVYHSRVFGPELSFSDAGNQRSQGHFGIFFPALDDLTAFSQVACALVFRGHRLDIILYTELDLDQAFISTNACALRYHSRSSATTAGLGPGVSSWISRLSGPLDVVIALATEDEFTASLPLAVRNSEPAVPTVVRLPREDLIYSDWMGTLSLVEWQSTFSQSQSWCYSDCSRLECTSRRYQHHYERPAAFPVAIDTFSEESSLLWRYS